jgi:hypothetical protein
MKSSEQIKIISLLFLYSKKDLKKISIEKSLYKIFYISSSKGCRMKSNWKERDTKQRDDSYRVHYYIQGPLFERNIRVLTF